MSTDDDALLRPSTNQGEIAFDYIKSGDFRVIWVDGAIGSPTPTGNIHFAVYAERPAFPRREVHALNPDTGELGPQIAEKRIGRNAVVREMACDLVMSPAAAKNLVKFLIEQIKRTGGEGDQ